MYHSRRHFIRALATASVGLFIVAGATIGATYAYFGARAQTKAHIKSGSIDIGFFFDGGYGKIVDPITGTKLVEVTKEAGTLVPAVDVTTIDGPVINVNNAMPGLDATYMFHVTNPGTVDFIWNIGFGFDAQTFGASALLDALKITLKNAAEETVVTFMANKFLDPNFSLEYVMGTLPVAQVKQDFALNLAIDYETVGNEIIGAELDFDLFVNAKSLDA